MSTLDVRCSMFIAGLCLVGCREQDANYCPGALNNNCLNVDAPVMHCTSDQQCSPNACDLAGSQECVQCTATNPAACIAMTPVCGADNACHGCTSHAQCSSNVCLADGTCAAEASVAYVAEGGSGNTCGKLTPCGTLDAGLKMDRLYVKIAAGLVKDNQTTTIDSKTVTILADPGAKLDRDGDGAILVVQSSGPTGANVQIFDLEITGATGVPGGDAIRLTANGGTPALGLAHVVISGNQGSGVASSGGSLTVSQSIFNGNQGGGISVSNGTLTVSQSTFNGNQGGGISASNGTFVVVGNVFFSNGGPGSAVGGIAITTTTSPVNRLEFNSFTLNQTQLGVGSAIQCVAGPFTARNNIMSDNGTFSQPDQFGGSCSHTYSIARPGMKLPGTTNSAADPMFVNPAMGDLHIQPGSPAGRAADPGSDLTGIASRDIDGNPRASPASIGAYEFHTQASVSTANSARRVGPEAQP